MNLSCIYCAKICKNENSKRQHERMCKLNPDQSFREKFTFKNHSGWNKGLTKETSESVLKYAQSLRKEKPSWQLEVDDDNKLYQRYLNKCVNAKSEGLECELTFQEYCFLVKDAHLVSSQLGFNGEGYVLARLNDEGNYRKDNCRFITQKENARERAVSDKSREASRRTMIAYNNNKILSTD